MKNEGHTNDLKNKLLQIYEQVNHKEKINEMNDDQLLELAENLKEGVPFATPVFDGAKEKDITALLEQSGVSTSGHDQK